MLVYPPSTHTSSYPHPTQPPPVVNSLFALGWFLCLWCSSLGIICPLVDVSDNDPNWLHRTSDLFLTKLQDSSGLDSRLNFRELGLLGEGPKPLTLTLTGVGRTIVLLSLPLLQTVFVDFLLNKDKDGKADGPRLVSQPSWDSWTSFWDVLHLKERDLSSCLHLGELL